MTDAPRTSRPVVLAVGLSCVDHLWRAERFPPTGSRTHASEYRLQGGGPAATAAAAAARLGAHARLLAVHGRDPAGTAALDELRALGVDVDAVRVIDGAVSFVSAVLVAPDGERWIFPYRGTGLEDAAENVPPRALDGVDCVVTDARHPVMAEAALREARERGIPTVGDWSDTRDWHLTRFIDHLLVSEECAALLSGSDDARAALAPLRETGARVVGVTLGERGVLLDDGSGPRHLPALGVEVVDTTGAGDAFHGAYAFAVARGDAPFDAARLASAVAALACRGLGRSTLPDLAEAEAFLASQRVDAPARMDAP